MSEIRILDVITCPDCGSKQHRFRKKTNTILCLRCGYSWDRDIESGSPVGFDGRCPRCNSGWHRYRKTFNDYLCMNCGETWQPEHLKDKVTI